MQNFPALGAPHPDPQSSPPIANFWLRAWLQYHIRDTGTSNKLPALTGSCLAVQIWDTSTPIWYRYR